MNPYPNWTLDVSEVQPKLDMAALALAHKIEREWPRQHVAPPFFQGTLAMTVRLARIVYRTVFYLCADLRQQEHEWRWYYTLAVPVLNRTILDGIFNVVFVLEDLPTRADWYVRSGWKEFQREVARYQKHYGDDPQWSKQLNDLGACLDSGAPLMGISEQDKCEAKPSPTWWPNPGSMITFGVNPDTLPPNRAYLQYLNDWFYREASAFSHQSVWGFIRMGGLLAEDSPGITDEQRSRITTEMFPQHRAVHVARTIVLLLSLLSEIEHYFSFGVGDRLVDIWLKVANGIPEAKEVYGKRYAAFWPIVGGETNAAYL